MAESCDGPLIRFCSKKKIPMKRYPLCFRKKKVAHRKNSAREANYVYDHDTSTDESSGELDEDDYPAQPKKQVKYLIFNQFISLILCYFINSSQIIKTIKPNYLPTQLIQLSLEASTDTAKHLSAQLIIKLSLHIFSKIPKFSQNDFMSFIRPLPENLLKLKRKQFS